jgi:flagellar biogenesis protein FliO
MENTHSHLIVLAPTKPAPAGRGARLSARPRAFSRALAMLGARIGLFWRAFVTRTRRAPKSLLLSETSALGDRRFVAVVQFERQRFLIGSSPSSVTLLARLPDAGPATKSDGATTPDGASQ